MPKRNAHRQSAAGGDKSSASGAANNVAKNSASGASSNAARNSASSASSNAASSVSARGGGALIDIFRPAAVLLVICAIVSAALAATYAVTKDAIAASELRAANETRADVMPGAADFEPLQVRTADAPGATDGSDLAADPGAARVLEIYRAIGADGASIGHVATASAKGYGGELTVVVSVLTDGTVGGVRILDHAETPGLGANASKSEFYGQFEGKGSHEPFSVIKGGGEGEFAISALSGATITSNAVAEAINAAIDAISTVRGEAVE